MTLPTTPIYGLPHERQTVLPPGRSLTGGPSGEDPILAEAVEAELERIEDDVASTLAAMFPATQWDHQPGVYEFLTNSAWLPSGTTTGVDSGTYVDCAVVFTAPASGRVKISYSAMLGIGGTGDTNTVRMEPQVRQGGTVGSGTVMSEPTGGGQEPISADSGSSARLTSDRNSRSRSKIVSGLTPGQTYNARLLHRTSTSGLTAAVSRRSIIVEPVS